MQTIPPKTLNRLYILQHNRARGTEREMSHIYRINHKSDLYPVIYDLHKGEEKVTLFFKFVPPLKRKKICYVKFLQMKEIFSKRKKSWLLKI
jgi:hypothetical protein